MDGTTALAPTLPSLLRKAPGRALWALAWPVIALGVLRSGYFLADAYWAGRMNEDAPAALSAMGGAAFATWILVCLGDLSAVGTHSLSARHEGGGERAAVTEVLTQGTWLSIALGLVLACTARPVAAAYFSILGFGAPGFERPLAMGQSLLEVLGWGAITLLLHGTTAAVFRGLGDTRTPMILSAATLVLNALLAPFLMFGWAGLPALGLAGAGWATVIANAVGYGLSLWGLSARGVDVRLGPVVFPVLRRVMAIGLPQAISGVGFCLVYVFLGDVLTRFGPQAIAGLGLGHRIEGPSFQVCMGFGAAAATLVGQNLGASRPAAALRSANEAAKLACMAMIPFTLAFVLFPRTLVGIWAPDAETIGRGAGYLALVGSVSVLMALEVVYESAFAGAGDTMPAMLVVLPLTALRIPLAAYLARSGLGLTAIWIAIAGTTAVKGLLLFGLFQKRSARFGRLAA